MNKGKEDKWIKTRLFFPRFVPTNLHRGNVKILQVMYNNLYAYNNYYWKKRPWIWGRSIYERILRKEEILQKLTQKWRKF